MVLVTGRLTKSRRCSTDRLETEPTQKMSFKKQTMSSSGSYFYWSDAKVLIGTNTSREPVVRFWGFQLYSLAYFLPMTVNNTMYRFTFLSFVMFFNGLPHTCNIFNGIHPQAFSFFQVVTRYFGKEKQFGFPWLVKME